MREGVTNPSSSTINRLSRESCLCRFGIRASFLASISSWARAGAVVNPTDHSPLAGGEAQSQGDVGLAGAPTERV